MTAADLLSFFVDLRPRQARRWSRLRSRGPLWFILVDGVLWFGGFMAVLALIGVYFLNRQFQASRELLAWHPVSHQPDLVVRVILPIVGIAVVDGLLCGVLMWYYMEWAYRRHQQRGASND